MWIVENIYALSKIIFAYKERLVNFYFFNKLFPQVKEKIQ